MNALGYVIAACIIIAAAQALAVTIVLGIYLAIVIGLFISPRETFSLLGFLLLAYAFQTHPVACLVTVSLVAIAVIVSGPAKAN